MTVGGGAAPYDPAKLINTSSGANLTVGGTWTNSSDRNRKENFAPVDARELLATLEQLPITMWNYKSEGNKVRHVGPVAQDFYRLFHLGGDDRSISTVDPSGIALAAIKELHRRNQELTAKNLELDARLAALEKIVRTLASGLNGPGNAPEHGGR
jgi:hypothetical protein